MKEPLTNRLQALADTPHMGTRQGNRRIITDAIACLSTITAILDGKEWDSETAESIADVLRDYGFEIRDLNQGDYNDN